MGKRKNREATAKTKKKRGILLHETPVEEYDKDPREQFCRLQRKKEPHRERREQNRQNDGLLCGR